MQRFELEIAHLAAKVDALAARGGDRTILAPVLRDIAELRDMLATGTGDARLSELSQQVSSLAFEVNRLRDTQPDGRELRSLSLAIEDVRSAVLSDRSQDRQPDSAASPRCRGRSRRWPASSRIWRTTSPRASSKTGSTRCSSASRRSPSRGRPP